MKNLKIKLIIMMRNLILYLKANLIRIVFLSKIKSENGKIVKKDLFF